MDYSFLKLYDSLNASLSDDLFKSKQLSYFTSIQLSPFETYLQVTNYSGGLSIDSDFTAYLVDSCGRELADITSNVFIEEFIDHNGQNQCKIEYVNLGFDFFGRAVHIKIAQSSSNTVYFTRPIKITNKNIEKTYRFDYFNDYGCYESIRLLMKLTDLVNNTDVSDYYQPTTGNVISYRPLKQIPRSFLLENTDTYTFLRLQELLFKDVRYIDFVRYTDKPLLESQGRTGENNIIKSSFVSNPDENDIFKFSYQIFEGLEFTSFSPDGYTVLCDGLTTIYFTLNVYNLQLNEGFVTLKNSAGDIVAIFDQSEMTVNENKVTITTSLLLANDDYTFTISEGLITALGIDTEETQWSFTLTDGDWLPTDFDNSDWLTGCE